MVEDRKRSYNMILTLIIILTLILAFLFQTSYAKYKKQINGHVIGDIADWNIKINNEDIRGKTNLTNAIEPTFLGDDYTKAGVIAPGTEGYFDLNIDATNADVNFTFNITASTSESSSVQDIIIDGYQIGSGARQSYTSTGITGNIVHNTAENPIRVFIRWNDSTGQSMDNQADTEVGTDDSSQALVDVHINLIQSNT